MTIHFPHIRPHSISISKESTSYSYLFYATWNTVPRVYSIVLCLSFTTDNMLGPLNICLEEFGVSALNGFLPSRLPLWRLPSPYYQSWEQIVRQLHLLLRSNRLRQEVDLLSVLSTSRLEAEDEWQRAYLLLSFMAHAYIWGGRTPSEVCPLIKCCYSCHANNSLEVTSYNIRSLLGSRVTPWSTTHGNLRRPQPLEFRSSPRLRPLSSR